MKIRRVKILYVLIWFMLAVLCANLIYAIWIKKPTYRTFVERQIPHGIKSTYWFIIVCCVFYHCWLVRRIKLKRSHLQIQYIATMLYYLLIVGILYFSLIFVFDLGERIYFRHLSLDDISRIIGHIPGVGLVICFFILMKQRLKRYRTKIEVLKRASYESFKDEEFDLSIEYVKDILEIDPKYVRAYGLWGLALGGSAQKKDDLEREILYKEANKKFEQAHEIDSTDPRIFHNWGYILSNQARRIEGVEADVLFDNAYEKFEQAHNLKYERPKLHVDWGDALFEQALKKEGEKRYQLLRAACEKFEKAYELERDKPDSFTIFQWGCVYLCQAELEKGDKKLELLELAEVKFREGLVIEPRDLDALHNCGIGLIGIAGYHKAEKREELLKQAKEKFEKVEKTIKGQGAYDLACVSALLGEEGECRRWLSVGEEVGTLPSREEAQKDEDLASVREKDWFQTICWGKKDEE